jgi:hypothetical protein
MVLLVSFWWTRTTVGADWQTQARRTVNEMTDLELLNLKRIAMTATSDDMETLAASVLELIQIVREQRNVITLMGCQSEDDVREGLISAQQRMIEDLRRQLDDARK